MGTGFADGEVVGVFDDGWGGGEGAEGFEGVVFVVFLVAAVVAADFGEAPSAGGEAGLLEGDGLVGRRVFIGGVLHDFGIADVAGNLEAAFCGFGIVWVELGERAG